MAEFIFKDIIRKDHAENAFLVESGATSNENVWNGRGAPVYQPAKRELQKHGISCEGKRARQITKEDYFRYDLIIGMEDRNVRVMLQIFGGDPEGKIRRLLDYTEHPKNIDDPWYTDDYDTAYREILSGCEALYAHLKERIKGEKQK